MLTENQTPAPATSGNVTLDDVRKVMEGMDPDQTGSRAIRVMLGNRGSLGTIQKHLETLRAEQAAKLAPPIGADQTPAMPAEAVAATAATAAAMWAAAWTAAQVQTLRRTEALAADRDAALSTLARVRVDVAELAESVDQQAGQLEQEAAARAKEQAAHVADVARLEAARVAAVELAERNANELDKARSDAVHVAEVAAAVNLANGEERARLTDQIIELRGYLRRDAAALVPPAGPV